MSEEPYMNGRGVIAHTERLNDDMIQASDKAAVSDALGFIAFLSLLAAFVFSSIFMALLALPVLYLCWRCRRPWIDARRAVVEHRRRMEEETAKRGRGWARS